MYLLWKSHGHFMMVSFSIKPVDQIDEAESPNLVNRAEIKGESSSAVMAGNDIFFDQKSITQNSKTFITQLKHLMFC